jgi:glycerophosphoryl diester phosphodiesterase
MRATRIIALTAAAIIAGAASPAVAKKPADADVVLVAGHRGASGLAPEETLASYDLAMKMKANYLEGDLHMTSDGVLVMIHDATLDRTARGPAESCTGLVKTKTLAQIETCDVGSWFNDAYPQYANPSYVGQRIPTLEQLFQRYGERANYYIETKDPEQNPGMEEALLALMAKYDLRDAAVERWQVLIQSFSPTSLQRIHSIDPELPLIQLTEGGGSAVEQAGLDAIATYAVGIGPPSGDVDPALVQAAHARCLDVHPYTVNDPAEMQRLIDAGVDGMFTNFPNTLFDVLHDRAIRGRDAPRAAARAHTACGGALSGRSQDSDD